jgi:hypothetical protein
MLRSAICSPPDVTGFSNQRTGHKIRSTPGEPAGWPDSARNGISRAASFFASLTQALSGNFTSMIAASGLYLLSHFSAVAQSGKATRVIQKRKIVVHLCEGPLAWQSNARHYSGSAGFQLEIANDAGRSHKVGENRSLKIRSRAMPEAMPIVSTGSMSAGGPTQT